MSKEMNACEFMKTMERLINSPNQKLIGDMRGGYVYASDTDKPELMYAATEISKANRRAMEAENRLDALKYAVNDVFGTAELHRKMALEIKKVIFNNPASIMGVTYTIIRFPLSFNPKCCKISNNDFGATQNSKICFFLKSCLLVFLVGFSCWFFLLVFLCHLHC